MCDTLNKTLKYFKRSFVDFIERCSVLPKLVTKIQWKCYKKIIEFSFFELHQTSSEKSIAWTETEIVYIYGGIQIYIIFK